MKRHLLFFGLFILIFAFAFRSLVLNITTNLIDWRDYAFVTWIINQNINHIRLLDFQNLFNLSAFYPYQNTIFLSDTFLTQSLIGLPFSFFIKNPIAIFNIIFFITFTFNYAASYLFFNKLFKKTLVAFLGSTAIIFSPFFYTQLGHFQMQSYWPIFIVLYFLIRNRKEVPYKTGVLIGLIISVQFLASVYLAFFGLAIISVFFAVKLFKRHYVKNLLVSFTIIIATFFVLDGIFIKGYINARRDFDIKRNVSELIGYSAHISDYLFPKQTGIFYQNPVIKKWQSFDKHQIGEAASFPGFILGILAILGIVKLKISKDNFSLHFSKELLDLVFLTLAIIGFTFSLGYPYIPFAKYIPLFDTIRGVARWSFILDISIVYFAISYISKVKSGRIILILAILLILDVFPITVATYKDSYISKNDEVLKTICPASKTVVLEIPVTHFDAYTNIAEGLSYITKRELATLYNGCILVNGYSGYDLPRIQNIKNGLVAASQTGNSNNFINTVKESGANYISINQDAIPSGTYSQLNKVLSDLVKSRKIQNAGGTVYRVN